MKHNVLILLLMLTELNISAQNITSDSLKIGDTQRTFYSSTNLRPVNLKKGKFLLTSQTSFTKYYKTLNPKNGSFEKISDKIVLNDVTFNFFTIFGINHKINLTAAIPVIDKHHYSPMIFSKGIGFGDINIGLNYAVINTTSDALSIRFDAGFPSGKSQNLTPSDIPLGTGAFSGTFSFAGIRFLKKYNLVYSAYYKYFTKDFSGNNVPNETGMYAFLQKEFNTEYGNFGAESGIKSYIQIPSSGIILDAFIGFRYAYNNKLNISFTVPYTLLQQNAFLIKYKTLLQFDYLLNKN